MEKDSGPQQKGDLTVNVIPFGPSDRTIQEIAMRLVNDSSFQSFLRKETMHTTVSFQLRDRAKKIRREEVSSDIPAKQDYRMISFQLVDHSPETKKELPSKSSPKEFIVTYYDYKNNRTIFARGKIDKSQLIEASESGYQPLPNTE